MQKIRAGDNEGLIGVDGNVLCCARIGEHPVGVAHGERASSSRRSGLSRHGVTNLGIFYRCMQTDRYALARQTRGGR